MGPYGIAPASHWYPDGSAHEVRSHHCGKCMNPFLSGEDCECACHRAQGGTDRTVVSAAVNHPVEGLDRDDMLGPQTGAEGVRK